MVYQRALSLSLEIRKVSQQVLHGMMFAGGLLGGGGDGGFLRQSPYTALDGLQFLILWRTRTIDASNTPSLDAGSDLTTLALFVNTLPEPGRSPVNTYLHNQGHTRGCVCTMTCLHNLSRLLYSTQSKP